MLILNNKSKKYIELKEKKVIFYGIIGKKTLKLDKIRSAHVDENNIVRILYGNKIRIFEVPKVKEEQKVLLKELVETLNIEEIVFFSNGEVFPIVIPIAYVPLAITVLMGNRSIFSCIFLMFYLLIIISMVRVSYLYRKIFIYDCINNEIKVESGSNPVKTSLYEIGEYNICYNSVEHSYKFETFKSKEISIPNNIIYPLYYKEKLSELYNKNNNIVN